jgi:hypothetical protein
MCTTTCYAGVFIATCGRKVLNSFNNHFNLASTKGHFLNSCPTCW